ncbi:MAG: ABC transporter ATP-binding protein [Anaerolineae bacterium]|nr:MAG: ABC transporter ATP-binding protein [Anaerolineae bacterium]
MKRRIPRPDPGTARLNRNEIQQYFRLARTYLRPYWREAIVLVIGYFAFTGLNVIQPLVMAPVLDIAIGNQSIFEASPTDAQLDWNNLDLNNLGKFMLVRLGLNSLGAWEIISTLAIVYLVITFLLNLINYANTLLAVRIRNRARVDMQRDLFQHLFALSLDFFNRQQSGELVSRLEQDTRATVSNLESVARNVIVSPILIGVYGYLLVNTSLQLTAIVIVAGVLQFWVSRIIRSPIRRLIIKQQSVMARAGAYLQEMFSSARVVKTFVAEEYALGRLKAELKDVYAAQMRYAYLKQSDLPLTGIINGITNVTILFLVARELISGALTPTGFFLYLYVGRSVLGPINSLVLTYNAVQQMLASEQRLRELMDQQPSVQSGPVTPQTFETGITLREVSFHYGDEPTLNEVSFEVKKGEMVALVGPSGAGKSTLTDLILRFYDPQTGGIMMDGRDIRELDLKAYRRFFGTVSQESLLFNASVAENIAYARTEITRAQIIAAAQVANAHEFIEQLPQGYDTTIGDRGVLISGGQRQRLAIARAVVRQPQILILDEATSSLDSLSERLVQDAIDRVIQNTTAIVIAHRLSTVRNAHKIVVLDQGRVVDIGKHGELMKRCALYHELATLQFGETDSPTDEGSGDS